MKSSYVIAALAALSTLTAAQSTPMPAQPQGNNQTMVAPGRFVFADMNRVIRDSVPGQMILDKLNTKAKQVDDEIGTLQSKMRSEEEAEPMQQQELQQKMMTLYQSRQELYQAAQQFIPMLFNDLISSKLYPTEKLRSENLAGVLYMDIAIALDPRFEITNALIQSMNDLYAAEPKLFASPFDEEPQAPKAPAKP